MAQSGSLVRPVPCVLLFESSDSLVTIYTEQVNYHHPLYSSKDDPEDVQEFVEAKGQLAKCSAKNHQTSAVLRAARGSVVPRFIPRRGLGKWMAALHLIILLYTATVEGTRKFVASCKLRSPLQSWVLCCIINGAT